MKKFEHLAAGQNAMFDSVKDRFSIDSDAELGRRLGVSPGTICNQRTGRHSTGKSMTRRLVETFGYKEAEIHAIIAGK